MQPPTPQSISRGYTLVCLGIPAGIQTPVQSMALLSPALFSHLLLQLGEDELIQNVIQYPHRDNIHPAIQEIHHGSAVPRLPPCHDVPDIWHPDLPHQSGKKPQINQSEAQSYSLGLKKPNRSCKLKLLLLYSCKLDFNRPSKGILRKSSLVSALFYP